MSSLAVVSSGIFKRNKASVRYDDGSRSEMTSGGTVMKRISIVLVLVTVFVGGVTAYAHHSFASTYDETKKITVEGKLVQFLWRNPHSFVHGAFDNRARQDSFLL